MDANVLRKIKKVMQAPPLTQQKNEKIVSLAEPPDTNYKFLLKILTKNVSPAEPPDT